MSDFSNPEFESSLTLTKMEASKWIVLYEKSKKLLLYCIDTVQNQSRVNHHWKVCGPSIGTSINYAGWTPGNSSFRH